MKRKTLLIIGSLIVLGMGLRFFPVNTGYHYWDETVYLQNTEVILGETGYSELDFRPPLLSVLLVPAYFLGNEIVNAHLVIALFSSGTIALTYMLGKKLFGNEGSAILAATSVAFSPLLLEKSHRLLVDPVLPFFWTAAAYLYLKQGRSSGIFAGLMTGLAVLAKFTSLVLLPALLLLEFLETESESFPGRVLEMFRTRNFQELISGFLLALSPYLFWNLANFGSALHPFSKAWSLSGIGDPFLTYVLNFHEMVLPVFLFGLFFLVYRGKWEKGFRLPAVMIAALLLPLQFLVSNKDPRFLTPLIPFLSLLAGRGIEEFLECWRHSGKSVAILGILSAAALFVQVGDVYSDFSAVSEPFGDPYYAGNWIQNETSEPTQIYANYRWAPLAYYSDRDVKPIAVVKNGTLEWVFDQPGYLYLSDREPDSDRIREFVRDGNFTHVKKVSERASVYRYSP